MLKLYDGVTFNNQIFALEHKVVIKTVGFYTLMEAERLKG